MLLHVWLHYFWIVFNANSVDHNTIYMYLQLSTSSMSHAMLTHCHVQSINYYSHNVQMESNLLYQGWRSSNSTHSGHPNASLGTRCVWRKWPKSQIEQENSCFWLRLLSCMLCIIPIVLLFIINELLLNFTNENLKYSFQNFVCGSKMCPPSRILDNFNPWNTRVDCWFPMNFKTKIVK